MALKFNKLCLFFSWGGGGGAGFVNKSLNDHYKSWKNKNKLFL